MYELDPELYFAIFLIIATGVVIGQYTHYGLFLYVVFITFVGLMTWASIIFGWDEDDDEKPLH